MGVRFSVADWAALTPERQSRDDWHAWGKGAGSASGAASLASLPVLLRRRVTPLGQMALRAAFPLASASEGPIRFVFASRHGEFGRTLGLLQALAADEPVSPAEFSLSVHNALAGLLSIACKNGAGHTTIAAGEDSFAAGLLEAATSVNAMPREPVLLVYYDEALPPPYRELVGESDDDTALAVALLVTAPHTDATLELACEPAEGEDPQASGPATAQALDFLGFYLSGAASGASRGGRVHWTWKRVAH